MARSSGAMDVAGEGASDRGFDVFRAGHLLPDGFDDDADPAISEAEQSPAGREIFLLHDAGGGEDVMDVGHRLHEAGIKLAKPDGLLEPPAAAAFSAPAVAIAFHQAKLHLAIIAEIAQKIGAGGFAFDEADLGELSAGKHIVLIRPEDAGAHCIDDSQRAELDLSGDGAIPHAKHPPAGFFFQRLMELSFTRHGTPLPE